MSEPLADELADAGGVAAPPQATARLRQLLADAMRHGAAELGGKRSGTRERPVTVALAADGQWLLAAVPVGAELHADAEAVGERAWLLVAAVVGALVDLAEPGPPASAEDLAVRAGDGAGGLALLGYPAPGLEPADARGARPARLRRARRRHRPAARAGARRSPPSVLGDAAGLREPLGAAHPLRIAEAVARLGGRPADPASVEEHDEAVLALLGAREVPPRARTRTPIRRSGSRAGSSSGSTAWASGAATTPTSPTSRAGSRATTAQLASEVGEALLAAGLLAEKPSVGQRHVFLNPRRAGDIHAADRDAARNQVD